MENAILGALLNDFVPKSTVKTHILREFRSYLMKDVYLCGVITGSCFFSSLLISHDLCKHSMGDTLVTAGHRPAAVPRQKRIRDLSPDPPLEEKTEFVQTYFANPDFQNFVNARVFQAAVSQLSSQRI